MQLVRKALIRAIVATWAVTTAFPNSTARAEQPLSLADMLAGKTYGNILAPQDYKITSPTGDINLTKGQPIANGIPLAAAAAFRDLSPTTAMQAAGISMDLNMVQANELKFLRETPLQALLTADPTLAQIKGEAIGWTEQGSKTLAEIAKTDAGKLPLPEAVLKSASIGQLGNIANTPYSKFPGAEQLTVSKFMGLSDIPLNKTIPVNLPTTGSNIHLVRIDKIRTQEKGNGVNPKIVTGSDQRPKAQWTSQTPVDVVELRDAVVNDKSNLVNGAVMVVGSSQMIPGGNIPCPLQPTALAIPGTDFAVSVESLNAKQGSAQIQLNMRFSYAFGLRTSYFMPVPLTLTVTEKSKTTLMPLEIPQPSLIATSKAITNDFQTAAIATSPLAEVVPTISKNLAPQPDTSPVATNIAAGNIGLAVKTNAINPAIGG
jgi:hypothetical protein